MPAPSWKSSSVGLVLAVLPGVLWAANFRIETDVYLPDQMEPVNKSLTLFSDGVVYDFSLVGSKEIAILDMQRQKFTLLDPVRQARTEFDCKELFQFNNQLQQLARANPKKLYKFCADPTYAEKFDRQANSAGLLTLTSGVIDYKVDTLKPPANQPDIAESYGTFVDWYARLNSIHPNELPPFPRLHLNAVLVKHGVVPTRVEKTMFHGNERGVTVRSEHKVDWLLTARDHQAIAQTAGPRVNYKLLKFTEYHVVKEAK